MPDTVARPRLVTAHGEVIEDAALTIVRLQDELAQAARTIRGQAWQIGELQRDRDAEARDHQLWPTALEQFHYWREVCKHPRSRWAPDKFWAWLPFAKEFGELKCKAAIAGAAFDHYSKPAKNGRLIHYCDWHGTKSAIFETTSRFEFYLDHVPPNVQAKLDEAEAATPAKRKKSKAAAQQELEV